MCALGHRVLIIIIALKGISGGGGGNIVKH